MRRPADRAQRHPGLPALPDAGPPHLYELYKDAARRRREPVRLTHRELDVLRRVALGMGTAQIAAQLVVSPSTVRKHLENAFGRLGVSSRTAAVARVFPEPEAL